MLHYPDDDAPTVGDMDDGDEKEDPVEKSLGLEEKSKRRRR